MKSDVPAPPSGREIRLSETPGIHTEKGSMVQRLGRIWYENVNDEQEAVCEGHEQTGLSLQRWN